MDKLIEMLQQLVNGVSLGSIYALIALGYTMVYGVLRFINFAHGDIYMLGAFAGFLLAPLLAHTFKFGEFETFTPQNTLFILSGAGLIMILSMTICAIIGVLIERIAYRPLRERPRLNVLDHRNRRLSFPAKHHPISAWRGSESVSAVDPGSCG